MESDNKPMSRERKKVLAALVGMTGQVYNGFICNWGPNGLPYADGRHFNYPCHFNTREGKKIDASTPEATTARMFPEDSDDTLLMTGHFKFGANQMPAYINMNQILCYLEKNYGLVIDQPDSDK